MTRCSCGHQDEVHQHYRDGSDCSICGRGVCGSFIDLADRDRLYAVMTAGQRIRLAESDAHLYKNLAALAEFNPGYRDRLARLRTIPGQRYAPTIRHELEVRRLRRNHRDQRSSR